MPASELLHVMQRLLSAVCEGLSCHICNYNFQHNSNSAAAGAAAAAATVVISVSRWN